MKKLPHNLNAERAVLGGLLNDNAAWTFAESLSLDDFSVASHRVIFTVMREMFGAGEHVDALTLADALERRGELESAGGATYIGELLTGAPGHCVRHYAPILRRLGEKRRLALGFAELSELALDATTEPEEVLRRAAQVVER